MDRTAYKYRNELTKQNVRHERQQETTSRDIEQAKRQLGQLQLDLAAAALQVKRLSAGRPTQSDSRMKEALNRMLDDADASQRHLPTNAFAARQPSPHSAHDIGLLFR